MKRCTPICLATLCLACVEVRSAEPAARPPITPAWALECWLWEDDYSTAAAILELLDGYEKNDIPARTIIVDAPWSTRYNDFRIDENRYPEPEKFFRDLKARGIRTVLWMTCMVNSRNNDTAIKDSSDWFAEAKAKGYLAGGGYQQSWWHGWGGFVDYENPEAMKWWRGMQQQVFDWGIDGWKLDDASIYFNSLVGALVGTRDLPPLVDRKGWMTNRRYMDHFYRDEYQHGLAQRGKDFITMSRSIDGRLHPKGFCPLDAAPVTWVGDQNHRWKANEEGIEEALHYILEAARQGYCVIGSDVGGYHGGTPIPANLHIRWAQFSAFCGLFLNGGHGERRLWKRDPMETPIIRKFAWLHNELVPFMYSHVVECHRGGKPLMRPIGKSDSAGMDQGSFHYLFGDDFLVAPIHEDSLERTVNLPPGRWRYLFDDRELLEGPRTIRRAFPLDEFPVYVREGAIVPMKVSRPYTGLGDRGSEGFLTWNIYPTDGSTFTQHHPEGGESKVSVAKTDVGWRIEAAGKHQPHLLRVYLEKSPTEVRLDGRVVEQGAAWRYDASARRLWIRTKEYQTGNYQIALGAEG